MATVLQDSDVSIHPGQPLLAYMQQGSSLDGAAGSVSTTSAAYDAMKPSWDLVSTIMEGTPALRAARDIYLPKHEYETEPSYRTRLNTSVLDNYLLRTLETLVGKAFKDPPHFNDDVPEEISDLFPDMDGQGNSVMTIARSWLREGIAKAFAHLWVDFTPVQPREDGQPRTKLDDQREGVRPYWRMVRPEDVRFMQGACVNGEWVLSQVRIYEPTLEPDGRFGEALVERIRVLFPGHWELWRKVVERKGRKPKWVVEDARPNPLGYIPWITYYTDMQGLAEGKPPLEDLAYLNVEHFQSKSDQRNILTVARFPMLATSGAVQSDENDGGKPLIVGPQTWLSMPDPNGKFYYVEHSGKAISAGRDDLQDLQERMSSYGAEFMKKPTSRMAATSRQMDSSEAVSMLQSWCYDFRDAINRALQVTADWLSLPTGGTVTYELEADAVRQSDQYELATLTSARARGDLSRDAFLDEMIRRGLLDDEFDKADDLKRLAEEPPMLTSMSQEFAGPVRTPAQPGLTPGRPPGPSTQGGGKAANVKNPSKSKVSEI